MERIDNYSIDRTASIPGLVINSESKEVDFVVVTNGQAYKYPLIDCELYEDTCLCEAIHMLLAFDHLYDRSVVGEVLREVFRQGLELGNRLK